MTDPMTAIKIAANTDDHDKIRELLALAIETGDAPLEKALRSRAASLGIIASPGRSGVLAKRIQEDYDKLINQQHRLVQSYDGALATGNVTNEYVLEATNYPLFMANIDSLTGDAVRNLEDAETVLAKEYEAAATISHSTDPTQALLDETRATKIWTRIERQLKTATDHTAVLATAIGDAMIAGDDHRLTLAVILTEAPSHLEARGVNNASSLIKEVAQKASPKLLKANEQVLAATKVLAVTRHNATVIRKATSTDLRNMPDHTNKVNGYLSYNTAL